MKGFPYPDAPELLEPSPHLAELETEEDRAILGWIAREVVTRHLTAPAILVLEGGRPLTFVGSQMLIFFRPFVSMLFQGQGYYRFATLMEDRANVERLLLEIERLDALLYQQERRLKQEERARRRERWHRRLQGVKRLFQRG